MIDFWKLGYPPSDEDRRRLEDYQRYFEIFSANHRKAFKDLSAYLPDELARRIYVTVNLPAFVVKKLADFLVGESPRFVVEGREDSAEQKALEQLVKDTGLPVTAYELAISTGFRGAGALRIRTAGERPDEGRIVIEEIPASNYFAERRPGNEREVLSQAIAWTVHPTDPKDKRCYLRVEHHTPGQIVHEAFELGRNGKVKGRVPLEVTDGPDAPTEEVEETGVDQPLVVYVPNFRIGGEFWGWSDFRDLYDVADAINNRLTQIDTILGRHAHPKLVAPRDMTLGDEHGNVDARRDYIEVENPDLAKTLPRYLTWEGQLEAAFKELDKLIDLFWALAEVSPAVLGLDKAGGVESGKALRLRFVSTEHKVNRRRLYLGPALSQALYVASHLAAVKLGAPYVALEKPPAIEWMDGLPLIYSEAVEDETRLYEAGLTSAESAIMRVQECTREQAQEELKRIREEREQQPEQDLGLGDLLNGGRENQQQDQEANARA